MGAIAWEALIQGAAAAAMAIGGCGVLAPCGSGNLGRGLIHALTGGRWGIGSVEVGERFLAVCGSREAVFTWAGGLWWRWIAGRRGIAVGVVA